MKKLMLLLVLCMLLVGCSKSNSKNYAIVENIILNQSTFENVQNTLPNANFKETYDEALGIFVLSDGIYSEYTINNVSGELRFDFDENNYLIHVFFSPNEYSKENGDALKTWLFDKYKDYEQTTKDTGFVFTNGSENIELYITENPIDNTKYHGLYIEWTVVE